MDAKWQEKVREEKLNGKGWVAAPSRDGPCLKPQPVIVGPGVAREVLRL